MEISNKNVLVTGANRGLGEAIVKASIEKGAAKVFAAVRDLASCDLPPILSHYNVVLVQLDVTSISDIELFANQGNVIDIVINNAGIASGSGFVQENSLAVVANEMAVNFFGPVNLINKLGPIVKAHNSAIVNVSSIAGICGFAAMGPYSASKAALHSFTQSLRGELKTHQIIGVYPGPIDTRLTAGAEIPKISPLEVANAIFEALENNIEEVFPDDYSKSCREKFLDSPKLLEAEFAASFV